MEFIKFIKWGFFLFFIFHFYFQYKNYFFLKKLVFEFEKNDNEIKKIEENLKLKVNKIENEIYLKINKKLENLKKINNFNNDYLNLLNWLNNSLNLFNLNEKNIEYKINEEIFLNSLLGYHKNQKIEILKNKNINILLNGPSGVGKNVILYDLAKSMNVPIEIINYNEINFNFLYGNKDEMSIFSKLILKNKTNNFILIFDEIDKMNDSNILLDLFNINTNKAINKIKDFYFDFEVDLSKIWIICISNKTENLSIPLKSRLKIIEFFDFSKEEKIDLIKNYLFPKIVKNLKKDKNFEKIDFKIDDYLINNLIEKYKNYQGIREIYIDLLSILSNNK